MNKEETYQKKKKKKDNKEKWVDVNIDGEDNRAIRYNYDSLEDPTSDSDGSFEDYLINT